jgi:hypothetical protein
MGKPVLLPCRIMRLWSGILSLRKSNGRVDFVCISILLVALISLPESLCGQERLTDQSRETYLLLSDGTIQDAIPSSDNLFVRGTTSSSNVFRPFGNVEGDGKFADRGDPGWLELSRNTFVHESTGMPHRPYVRGFLGSDKIFRPESREVIY